MIDCHMHTPFCGHAHGEPEDYVRAAADRGLSLITFTCHIPLDPTLFGGPHIRMPPERLPSYIQCVREAASLGKGMGVEVLLGIEAEIYFDEKPLQAMDGTLASHTFDFVLGSLHHHCPGYSEMLLERNLLDDDSRATRYFEDLIRGVHSKRYDSIAHPDVIRDYGGLTEFHPNRYEPLIREFLQALLDTDTCMEVNTSGLIKNSFQVHPHPTILDWASEMNIPITMGSDSHRPEQVGQGFREVILMLREKGFREVHYFKGRRRESVPLNAAFHTV